MSRDPGLLANLRDLPKNVWRSLFRNPLPSSDLGRSQTSFANFFLHIHPVKTHVHSLRPTYTFGLGVIAFSLFIILAASGILLMFYYVPSVEQAHDRMLDLSGTVAFGVLLRNMHRWAAHGMVAIVLLHMARVFFTGSYKAPREFNWVIGIVLLLLTFFASFTGYLLPWDQKGYWATDVATNIAGTLPADDATPARAFTHAWATALVRRVVEAVHARGATVTAHSGMLPGARVGAGSVVREAIVGFGAEISPGSRVERCLVMSDSEGGMRNL